VDEVLVSKTLPRMSEDELQTAVGVIWGERDEGGPRWAIRQAVEEVLKRRRGGALGAARGGGGL